MFGFIFGSSPAVRGMVSRFYSPPSIIKEFQENGKEIERIENSLFKSKKRAAKKQLKKEGNQNATEEQIQKAIDDGKGENSVTKLYQDQIDKLVNKQKEIIDKSDKRMNNVHSQYLDQFSDLKGQQLELQSLAQETYNDNDLSESEKSIKLDELSNSYDNVTNQLNIMGNSNLFRNSRFTNFINSISGWRNRPSDIEDRDRRDALLNEAAQELLSRGNNNPTEKEILTEAEIIYNTQEINKDYKSVKKNRDLGDFTNLQTVEDAVKWIQNKEEFTDNEKAELIKEVQDGAHGSNIKKGDNNYIAFQVVENMEKDGRLETRTHEIGHTALGKIIGQNPEAFRNIANQLIDYVDSVDPALGLLLRQRTRGLPVDEVITNFMELVGSNKVLKKNK